MLKLETANLPQNYFSIHLITAITHKHAFSLDFEFLGPKVIRTEYRWRTRGAWKIQLFEPNILIINFCISLW